MTALACVEVFALGGRAGSTDASESGYFALEPCSPRRFRKPRGSSPIKAW